MKETTLKMKTTKTMKIEEIDGRVRIYEKEIFSAPLPNDGKRLRAGKKKE